MTLETIQFLNESVWCTIAPSPIHGVGVFALRDIKKGQKLNCYGSLSAPIGLHLTSFEGLDPEIAHIIRQRWPLAVQGDTFHSPNDDVRHILFMNNSPTPNYNQQDDVAITDIAKGVEITEDYGSVSSICLS